MTPVDWKKNKLTLFLPVNSFFRCLTEDSYTRKVGNLSYIQHNPWYARSHLGTQEELGWSHQQESILLFRWPKKLILAEMWLTRHELVKKERKLYYRFWRLKRSPTFLTTECRQYARFLDNFSTFTSSFCLKQTGSKISSFSYKIHTVSKSSHSRM